MAQGPAEVTGRFNTRNELELFIHNQRDTTSLTRREMAVDADISIGTVQSILKKTKIERVGSFPALKKRMLVGKW